MALPQIYADPIEHKGYSNITYHIFGQFLKPTHPCNSFVFQICNDHLYSINAKKILLQRMGGHIKLFKNVLCNI